MWWKENQHCSIKNIPYVTQETPVLRDQRHGESMLIFCQGNLKI
jgi:hypothetical protein